MSLLACLKKLFILLVLPLNNNLLNLWKSVGKT